MRKGKGLIAVVLAAVLCLGGLDGQTGKVWAEEGENLIINGSFENPDQLEVWNVHQNGATITAEVSETPVVDGITTYGKITNRTSNYQCFAQNVTDKVEKNQTYYYTFYVMLDPEDYKDAPAEQRSVEISPHIRANGSDSYSQGVNGTVQQILEPGVWTKFTGTFTPTWSGQVEMVALRFLEQGTQYGQGPGVKGTYYVTGIELYQKTAEPVKIQKNIVDLKNAVTKVMGEDFIVGTSIVNSELTDVELMGLVTKHFNAVTLGNELKPDAMFGYSNNPRTETVVFQGEELLVPVLDFSRAERTLDVIYKWNKNHPEDTIRVRGHVLVWHSQTPDWFFYENYKTSGKLVDAETMSKRLEWYIASVAEHFTGEDSKYKDMFYGWDVVNEAVSDSTGTYRSDKENSKWWAVYQSNEFIIQAFRFANKYLPESVDLYYNDYNEFHSKKVQGIAQLLRDVKEAEGTRIDGMGMQGHYETQMNPTTAVFENAARTYGQIVDKVQITEWDLKVSSDYIGTEYSKETEYRRQANRYHSFYESMKKLQAEGINFCGMTFWGVIDPNSWLQTSNSVGGAADGKSSQLPLLFDGDYKAKLAFWAFADEEKYLSLTQPTPTPSPEPTPAPKPTEAPTPTEAPEPTGEPVPTEALDAEQPDVTEPVVQSESTTGMVYVAVAAGVVVLLAAGILIIKKKRR